MRRASIEFVVLILCLSLTGLFSCATTPKNSSDYFGRGSARSERGDHRGAIEDYNKAIELGSRSSSDVTPAGPGMVSEKSFLSMIYYNRACAKEKLGDHLGAIQDYNKTIELDPKDEAAYSNRALIKQDLGDFTGAIKDFDKAIKLLVPGFERSSLYYNRGFDKSAFGDFKGAIKDFNTAIKLNPKYVEAYYSRGKAKEALGDKQGALKDLSKAEELGIPKR